MISKCNPLKCSAKEAFTLIKIAGLKLMKSGFALHFFKTMSYSLGLIIEIDSKKH
jgi:hypothetical protein